MKKLILAIIIAFWTSFLNAYQSTPLLICPGFYIEGQVGYGNQYFDKGSSPGNQFNNDVITSVHTNESNNGVAGRLQVGYIFNPYLGLEVGGLKLTNLNWDIITNFQSGTQSIVHMTTKTYAIDVLGKIAYPIICNFIIYGKGGIAYVNTNNHFSNGGQLVQDSYRPEVAAGFSIPFTTHLAVDTTYSYIFRKADLHKNDHTPALNTLLIGLIFKF